MLNSVTLKHFLQKRRNKCDVTVLEPRGR